MRSLRITLGVVVGIALFTGACGGDESDAKPAAGATPALTAKLSEFAVELSVDSVKAGPVVIKVTTVGAITHEFVVFGTDLDEASLPLKSDATAVDEAGAGITHFDPEAEDVESGKSKTITVDLAAGRYVLICNLPAHYKQGMHAVLNVV